MLEYSLEADEIGVKHISQCSALKVIDFSVMNAVTLLCLTNKINRKKSHKKSKDVSPYTKIWLKCTNSAHGG